MNALARSLVIGYISHIRKEAPMTSIVAGHRYPVKELVESIAEASAGNGEVEVIPSDLEYSMSPEGALSVRVQAGRDYPASETAEQLFCSFSGIPYSYWRKCSPALRLTNLRSRMSTMYDEARVLVNDDLQIVRGIVPTNLSFVPNFQAVDALDDGDIELSGVVPLRSYADRTDIVTSQNLSFRALLGEVPSDLEPGDNFFGLNLSVSELGGKFSVAPILYRLSCSNGLGLASHGSDEAFHVTYRKLDAVLAQGLVKSVATAWAGKSHVFSNLIDSMDQDKMTLADVRALVDKIAVPKKHKKIVLSSVIESGIDSDELEISKWGLLNIMTSAAQDFADSQHEKIEAAVAATFGLQDLFSRA